MKVMLKASPLDEYTDGPNCLLIELDDVAKKDILDRRELLQMVLSKDKDLYELAFWSIPGDFYSVDWDELSERLGDDADELETKGYLIVDDDFVFEEEVTSTEVEMTCVTTQGVYFRAGIEHSSAYVESRYLSYAALVR